MVARRFASPARGGSMMDTRSRIREMMARSRGGSMGGGGVMERGGSRGGEVPGLRGVHFSPDMGTAMRKAAESVALWNSPNRMNHPAIGWSRGMAGIDGLAGGSIDQITGDVERRLAEAGIIRTDDGWTIAGVPNRESVGGTPSALASRVSQITPPTINGRIPGTTAAGPDPSRPPVLTGTDIIPGTSTRPAPTTPPSATPSPSPAPSALPPASTGQVPGTLGTGQVDATGADVIGAGGSQPPSTLGVPPPPSPTPYPAPGSPAASQPSPSAALHADETAPGRAPASLPIPPPPVSPQPPTDAERAAVLPTNRSSGIWPTAPPNVDGSPIQAFPTMQEARNQEASGSTTFQPDTALLSATPSMYAAATPEQVPGTLGTGQTDASGAGVIGTGAGGADPGNAATATGSGQVGSGVLGTLPAQTMPTATPPATGPAPSAPAPTPAPAPAPAAPAPAPQGTPPVAGPPSTPTVAPGSVPGQSTPSRPGAMPTMPSTRRGGPAAPPAPMPTSNLSGLGDSIRTWVDQIIGQTSQRAGQQPGGIPALEGLGDRIRASVAAGQQQAGMRPGGGLAGLSPTGSTIQNSIQRSSGDASIPSPTGGGVGLGTMASGIMDQVRNQVGQLAQQGAFSQGNGVTPAPGGGQFDPMSQGYTPLPGTPPGSTPPTTTLPNQYQPGPGGTPVPAGIQSTTLPNQYPTPTGTDWSSQYQQLGATPSNQFQYFSAPSSGVGAPQGAIQAPLQIAFGRGGTWDAVNQYDASYVAEGTKHGVDPAMLKAMAVIESGGQMIPNQNGSGAYGIMQIKAADWQADADRLGYDLNTPEGQIGMAAAILGGQTARTAGMTPEEAFVSVYYPTGGLDVPGEDGHTPRDYLADMNALMAEINGAAPPTGGPISQPGGAVPGAEGSLALPPISQPGGVATLDPNNPATAGGGTIIGDASVGTGSGQSPTPGVGAPTPAAGTSPDIQGIVADVGPMIGTPYNWGGIPNINTDPAEAAAQGADCSGFTRYTLQRQGYLNIPVGSEAQMWQAEAQGILTTTETDPTLEGIQEGDLVFYDTEWAGGGWCTGGGYGGGIATNERGCINDASHVGIYVGPTEEYPEGAVLQSGDGAIKYVPVSGYFTKSDGTDSLIGYASPGDYGEPIGEMYTEVVPGEHDQWRANGGADQGALGTVSTTQPMATTPAAAPAATPAAAESQPMQPPSYYASNTTTPTTGQVTTDAAGRQYETMADGSLRLIYDPAW